MTLGVGRICVECDKPVRDGDIGFVMFPNATEFVFYHQVCFLRTVIPCQMWDDEMKTDMPDRWRQHWDKHHSHLT